MGLKDIFSPLGGLEKLKITAFEDDDYAASTATYVVMYNPTSFSYQVTSEWIPEEGVDPDARQLQFRANKSDSVSFEFLFDATGASPPGKDVAGGVNLDYLGDEGPNLDLISGNKESAIEIIEEDGHVDRAINKYLEITQNIQSATHTPNYLQINWGAYQFRGVVQNSTINYKLFNSAGLPIRATVTTSFVESLSRKEQAAEAGRESADLTHKRIVKAGDTLPLIAKRIYGDPAFYVEIARANNLKNLRNLEMGQELILPPIKK
jgi:LysM repeat protein